MCGNANSVVSNHCIVLAVFKSLKLNSNILKTFYQPVLFSAVLRLLGVVETSYTENLSTGCYRIIYPSQPTRKMYAIDYSIGQYFFFSGSQKILSYLFCYINLSSAGKEENKNIWHHFSLCQISYFHAQNCSLLYRLHGVCSFGIKSIGAKFTYVVTKINLFTKKCI